MEDSNSVIILPSGIYNLKYCESYEMEFPALELKQVFYILDKDKDKVLIINKKIKE